MLLIDSLYVNMGGAKGLLDYLCSCLIERRVEFMLLKDERCGRLECEDDIRNVIVMKAGLKERKAFYKQRKDEFSCVFCFGNVPPPMKLVVPVYTYFHNVNMLTLSACRDKKQWLQFWLKRAYIRSLKDNTDEWFVQTSNTANEAIRHLCIPAEKVKLFPFYRLPSFPKAEGERNDYIFVGEYSGSKGHDELLKAWRILHEQDVNPLLHLTVSDSDYLKRVKEAVDDGVTIVNHGFIPMEQLAQLYMQSKATIYPSYNESFGLGLVEAMEAGCDVIAADRPYVHAICRPSEVFAPSSPQAIADAVLKYEDNRSPKTEKTVENRIDEMIMRILN